MNPVPASNPAGEQLAEAILAAALALPLAFAMAGVKHSRLIRDLDSLPKINWSSPPNDSPQHAKALASPMPALRLATAGETKTKSHSRKSPGENQVAGKLAAAAEAHSPGGSQTPAASPMHHNSRQPQSRVAAAPTAH